MFTDDELIELHADKEYKKTNGFFRNVHFSRTVIRNKCSGISLSFSTAGTASFSVSIISILWFVLRYFFITKEITGCRSRIIEELLNINPVIGSDKLINNFVKPGNIWLEDSREKIIVLGNACVEYITTAEHRAILSSHSHLNNSVELTQKFQKVHAELERIFRSATGELELREINMALFNYTNMLNNDEYGTLLKRIFFINQRSGNLTSSNNSSAESEGGSNDL
jgi:hypothetical protein